MAPSDLAAGRPPSRWRDVGNSAVRLKVPLTIRHPGLPCGCSAGRSQGRSRTHSMHLPARSGAPPERGRRSKLVVPLTWETDRLAPLLSRGAQLHDRWRRSRFRRLPFPRFGRSAIDAEQGDVPARVVPHRRHRHPRRRAMPSADDARQYPGRGAGQRVGHDVPGGQHAISTDDHAGACSARYACFARCGPHFRQPVFPNRHHVPPRRVYRPGSACWPETSNDAGRPPSS
jgi:hypothetical protein